MKKIKDKQYITVFKHKFNENYLILDGVRNYNPDWKRYEERPMLNVIEKGEIKLLEEKGSITIAKEFYEFLCKKYLPRGVKQGNQSFDFEIIKL